MPFGSSLTHHTILWLAPQITTSLTNNFPFNKKYSTKKWLCWPHFPCSECFLGKTDTRSALHKLHCNKYMLLSNPFYFTKVFNHSFFQHFSENATCNADYIRGLLKKAVPVALRLEDANSVQPQPSLLHAFCQWAAGWGCSVCSVQGRAGRSGKVKGWA